MATAGLFTTAPLALGLALTVEGYTLTAEALDVPITQQDVALAAANRTADIGTSHPLALGLVLGTSGTTNYTMTAEAFALPITMQDVLLTPKAPAGVQTTFPLALGILLDAQSFVLTAEAFSVPISFAPGEALTIDVPEPVPETADNSGGWASIAWPRRRRTPAEEALERARSVIATAAELDADELEARIDADTERIRARRAKRSAERRSQELTEEIKRLLDERLGAEEAIAQADDESAALALILTLA